MPHAIRVGPCGRTLRRNRPENSGKDDDFNRATKIVADIRKAIFDELGFTCSAGISVNKMAAKFIAGLKKPNAQDRISHVTVSKCVGERPLN